MPTTPRIAVVGAGISGLACAWLLSQRYPVTLFEASDYLGGYAHSLDVQLEGITHPVDLGVLVFNERSHPNLSALFEMLGVNSIDADMSFSVSLENPDLEWASGNLATIFGQKRNLLRRQFWFMLCDIMRFNRESVAWLLSHPDSQLSLWQFLQQGRYSFAFSEWYLLPMAATFCACSTIHILAMPLATLVRFFQDQGLLQIQHRPQWRSIQGGSREYVNKLAAQVPDIRLPCPLLGVQEQAGSLRLNFATGSETFDQVVMACHSDQSLALLGDSASAGQRRVLSAISYQPHRAVLHSDPSLLPRNPRLWSAWNYFADSSRPGPQAAGVSYLINRIQPLPFLAPLMVSLNPTRQPAPDKVVTEFDYRRPLLDCAAIAAQKGLAQVQGERGIWLCGAWGRYGFHEDGLLSAIQVANSMGIRAPWQNGVQLGELRMART